MIDDLLRRSTCLACIYISLKPALGDLKVVEFDTSGDESRLSPKISAGRAAARATKFVSR
jgi:hypothetical protein